MKIGPVLRRQKLCTFKYVVGAQRILDIKIIVIDTFTLYIIVIAGAKDSIIAVGNHAVSLSSIEYFCPDLMWPKTDA